ncbi:glycosyltransferase family 2 protein [Candidatus Woesearchaeota archaeon]|nr:glycosyltransferase family 2 protein [Candidatus Woesearchaeota archaeon]
MVDISIVVPVFNEEKNVGILYSRLTDVLRRIKKAYEIIFVDDGSNDRSFYVLRRIHEKDKRVKIIKFRKNFGQTAALDAGFKNSKGMIIITIDADLQNDPDDIPRLLEKMEEGYDVVSGWRIKRKDSLLKKIPSKFSNLFVRKFTKVSIHDSGCTLKAYKKECFNGLDLYGEMHRFIPGLLKWKGFKIGEIKVKHHPRRYGQSKYGVARLLKGFLDLLIIKFWMQYSARPIHLFGGFGILFSSVGFVIGLYLTIIRIFFNQPLSNRPLLLLALLLIILGVQLVVFGVLADIMIKVYYKEGRDVYSIEKKLG